MRLSDTLTSLRHRAQSLLPWISVVAFGGLFGLFGIWGLHSSGYQGPRAWVAGAAGPLLVAAGYGFLSPLPWQWTGDERPLAGNLRGAFQALAFSLCLCLLVHYLGQALFLGFLRRDGFSHFGRLAFFPYLFQTPFLVLVGRFIALAERGEHDKRRAESRLKEAQWILLRTQLSPHVLFNTLNALAELARRDPEATERALLELSELYERMLHHGEQLLAPLVEERKVLECYLTIQRLRFGDRLRVSWSWDVNLDAVMVPPLLLQPLVENALKHGIAPQSGLGNLSILASREGNILRLEVRNTGIAPTGARPGATGLHNLEERLILAYGGRARFQLRREEPWTVATLELPEVPWV
jgi:hypothetical protein